MSADGSIVLSGKNGGYNNIFNENMLANMITARISVTMIIFFFIILLKNPLNLIQPTLLYIIFTIKIISEEIVS